MMSFQELQLVRVLCDVTDMWDKDHLVPAGSVGTVVSVYAGGAAYCVEFTNHQALVDIKFPDLILADANFVLAVEIVDGPAIKVTGFDSRDKDSVFAKLDEWCERQWSQPYGQKSWMRVQKWRKTSQFYKVDSEAMAFEFRMRWHGVDFNGLFATEFPV